MSRGLPHTHTHTYTQKLWQCLGLYSTMEGGGVEVTSGVGGDEAGWGGSEVEFVMWVETK